MESIKKTVGENLRTICKVKDVKNKQIAEALNVSESSVSNWLKGKNSFDIDNLYAICGSYCLNRDNVKTCLQNIIIIEDNKAIESFNKKFDKCVNNSYRISNAKYMLLREKFFKNFV